MRDLVKFDVSEAEHDAHRLMINQKVIDDEKSLPFFVNDALKENQRIGGKYAGRGNKKV